MNDELSLFDLLLTLLRYWKIIVVTTLIAIAIVLAKIAITPQTYEARALLQIGSFYNVGIENRAPSQNTTLVETPDALIERLQWPSTYTAETMQACGFTSESDQRALNKSINATNMRKLDNAVELRVTQNSQSLARSCLTSVIEMITTQENALAKKSMDSLKNLLQTNQGRIADDEKFTSKLDQTHTYPSEYFARQNDAMYLRQISNQIQFELNQDHSPRLITPIYTPKSQSSMQPLFMLFAAIAGGILLGCLFAMTHVNWLLWREENRARSQANHANEVQA